MEYVQQFSDQLKHYFDKIEKKKQIVLYGYGTIGKAFEEYILKHRKDLNITHIIDQNINISTRQKHIQTTSLSQINLTSDSDTICIICNDVPKNISSIKESLASYNINFIDDTLHRKQLYVQKPKSTLNIKEFLLFPYFALIVLVTTPIKLIQALYSCRILFNGKWSQYNRFSSHRAMNSLFYWTQTVNIDKYGMNSYSPSIANGKYALSKWFHLSLFSSYCYKNLGAITPILGMFLFLCSHLLWINQTDSTYALLILLFLFTSSIFYANTFEMQNYNAIGWIFFPIGLYGLYTQNYELAALGWLLVTFGSFTAWFNAGIITVLFSLSVMSIEPIIYFLPSCVKIFLHFLPLIKENKLLTQLLAITEVLGAKKHKAKYKRIKQNNNLLFSTVYYTIIYGQFFILHVLLLNEFNLVLFSFILILILNQLHILRYADPGSIHLPIISICTVCIMMDFSLLLFISYLIAINPIAKYLDFAQKERPKIVVPTREPFYIEGLINDLAQFFKKVDKGQRVLFCFENPQGVTQKIFDGQRTLLESALYIASTKEFHLFPDWYLISEDNSKSKIKEFWGRDTQSIKEHIKEWNCDYILFYSENEHEEIFNDKRYEVISKINWPKLKEQYNLNHNDRLKISWYLMKYKEL